MDYRIEIRDRDFEFVNILDNRIFTPQWNYNRMGGCAGFSLQAESKYCTELDFGGNFNIQIKLRNSSTKDYDLWYQGRVENVKSKATGNRELVSVNGFGYQSELKDIVINETYTSDEISVIVKDILDTHIVPNTNITYSAGDITATSFTPDSMEFKYVTAQEAFNKLAENTGSREWGVDKDRKFFFKQRSTVEGFRYPIGPKLTTLALDSSSREIINKVIVIGGQVAGSQFVYTKEYAKNQLKYKRRDKIIQNSSVMTNEVAEQLADSVQADFNGIVDRGNIILKDDIQIESTIPIPLFKVLTREIGWNEKNWNTFLWAGQEPFQINSVGYKLDTNSNLILTIQLGKLPPDSSEDIKRLEFQLNQVRQGA